MVHGGLGGRLATPQVALQYHSRQGIPLHSQRVLQPPCQQCQLGALKKKYPEHNVQT